MRKSLVAFFLIGMVMISGCCEQQDTSESEINSVNDGSMGDLRVETENKDTLPHFLDNHHENMQILYRAVAQHKELLEHIPCYCGCGDSVDHGHNYHCFVHENNTDGSIVWDDHAARCQVCLDIAAEAIVDYNEGKSINDIRDIIDEKYGDEGYPDPTDTPRFAS